MEINFLNHIYRPFNDIIPH
jgi:hypothetical protein